MSEEVDQKAIVEKKDGESVLDVADRETSPEEVPQEPAIDHSKLYVWIADSGNDRIQKFDGNGKFISQFGSSGGTRPPYNPGECKTPSGVTVDVEGNIWVADTGCHRIQKFDEDLDFIFEFGTKVGGRISFTGQKISLLNRWEQYWWWTHRITASSAMTMTGSFCLVLDTQVTLMDL